MPLDSTVTGGLARRRLGAGALVFFTVSASAPMTVLAGALLATFAVTHVVGTPLAFPILAVALAFFAVGYAAMSRYIFNAGAFYSYIAQGLGRAWGVSGSFVALAAYNAIQISLYGLLGFVATGFASVHHLFTLPWWGWALIAWAIVGLLGIKRIDLNARVLAVLLVVEVAAVLLFDVGSVARPAGGVISLAALNPKALFVNGIGGVFAFGVACFVGFEQAASYGEEAKRPGVTVARATYAALGITGVLYTVSAWALTIGTGPDQIVAQSQDATSGIPFSLMQANFGAVVAEAANVLLATSVFAALLSFHNGVARYLYASGRERVLPTALAHTAKGPNAPIIASAIQSGLALAIGAVFVLAHLDPLTQLFTWLSYVSAVGVLVLMLATSLAVIGFFRRQPSPTEGVWQRVVAPTIAALLLLTILGVTVFNSAAVLGADKSSPLVWILPGIPVLAAVLGLLWGLVLRKARPEVYAGIGLAGDTVADGAEPIPGRQQPADRAPDDRPSGQLRV